MCTERIAARKGDIAALQISQLSDPAACSFRCGEDAFGLPVEDFPCGSQDNLSAESLKKTFTQFFLEEFYVSADSRLCDEHPCRSPSETVLLSDGDK